MRSRFSIQLPPLRDRISDLSQLVPALCEAIGEAIGRPGTHVSAGAMARLRRHSWPGNVRELRDVLEQLIAYAPDRRIAKRHVADALGGRAASVENARSQREQEQKGELLLLLDETGGNLSEVARRLDLSRSAVHYRVQKYGLL